MLLTSVVAALGLSASVMALPEPIPQGRNRGPNWVPNAWGRGNPRNNPNWRPRPSGLTFDIPFTGVSVTLGGGNNYPPPRGPPPRGPPPRNDPWPQQGNNWPGPPPPPPRGNDPWDSWNNQQGPPSNQPWPQQGGQQGGQYPDIYTYCESLDVPETQLPPDCKAFCKANNDEPWYC